MTDKKQSGNNDAENKQRASKIASDLLPGCPRCGDLRPVGSFVCLNCGCRLTLKL